jgi:hypothetical protein
MASGHTETLLFLMGIVQVYEFLLTGLAWFLISSRRAERDGRILLLLEIVFLIDATYLTAEYSAADPHGGALVSLLTLILAFVKVGVMFRALGLRFHATAHAFLLAHFGALLSIPLLSAQMFQQSSLGNVFFYGVWWLVGLLPLLQGGMVSEFRRCGLRRDWLRPLERNFRIAFIVLPYASACWHAASMHWVYGFPFHASYWTPIVLGLGLSLSLMGENWFARAWCVRIRWLTPLLALLWSVHFPNELLFPLRLEPLEGVLLSPLRIALLAAAIVYVFSFLSYRWRPFLWTGAMAFLLAVSGHSIVEACMMSIVGAFVFLMLGAAVSLSNGSRPPRMTRRP